MNIKKFVLVFSLFCILVSCESATDALQQKKRSENSDEFLVEKKNPLVLPPDYGELPVPVDQQQETSLENQEDLDIKKILEINENNQTSNENTSQSSSFEETILEKIKN